MSEKTIYDAEPNPKNYKNFTDYRIARTKWRVEEIEGNRPELNRDWVWQSFHRVTLKKWIWKLPKSRSEREKRIKKTIPAIQTFVNEKKEEIKGKTSREIGKIYGHWLSSLNLI